MAFGVRPVGMRVNSEFVAVRTTATSAERVSTAKSKRPLLEKASADGPSPTRMEPIRLPSSME